VKKLQDPKDHNTMWYVMRATKNAAINIYNKKKRHCNKEMSYDDMFAGEDVLERYQEVSELSKRILELSPRDRDILMLKYVHGYEYSEIASGVYGNELIEAKRI
jgi:RNA polymerase sigma-70 factor (ECF subfamily)